MQASSGFGLFGTKNRTNVLLLLGALGESHASELSRLAETSVSNVQKILDSLEQSGAVAGVIEGRQRRVSLNPRYFAYDELKTLIEKLTVHSPELLDKVADVRRRSRRAGKNL